MIDSFCPGCGLVMPKRESATSHGYYNASPECWLVYTEVLAAEYSNAVLFGQAHQLTVDTYAVQHAGGPHPDKSVDVHLCGLHLVLQQGWKPVTVPPILQRIAGVIEAWPHYDPPPQIAVGSHRDGQAMGHPGLDSVVRTPSGCCRAGPTRQAVNPARHHCLMMMASPCRS